MSRTKNTITNQSMFPDAETELAFIKKLFNSSPSFLCTLRGKDYVFELANNRFFEIVGKNDIIGKTVLEAFPEVVEKGFLSILNNVYTTGETFKAIETESEVKIDPNKPPVKRTLNYTFQAIRDEAGTITGIFLHGTDVTDHVKARKHAEETGELYKTYAEAMPQMAFIADAQGNIIFFNKRWYEYIDGLEGTEGWGWKDKPIHHPDDRDQVVERWKHSLKTGEPYEMQYRIRRHDGQFRWHLGRALPLKDKNGKVVIWLGTNTDIHDQKRATELRDEFLGIASHELKTPLTSIKAYGQVLERNLAKEGNQKGVQMVHRMNDQITKLTTLVADLLDITKIESGKLVINQEVFEFNDLAKETVEDLQMTTEKHTLELKLGKNLAVCADRDRIEQVMINFITNAIKYSLDSERIVIRVKAQKQHVIFSVQDFGMGIPKEQLEQVFQQFFRVQDDKLKTIPGLGLGLYISSEIIHRQGGKIWVESEEGKGSTFYFSLPVHCPPEHKKD